MTFDAKAIAAKLTPDQIRVVRAYAAGQHIPAIVERTGLDHKFVTGVVVGILGVSLPNAKAIMRERALIDVGVRTAPVEATAGPLPVYVPDLSDRERQVLVLLAQSASRRIIAEHLGIAPSGVGTHIRNLCNKLGVAGQADIVGRAQALSIDLSVPEPAGGTAFQDAVAALEAGDNGGHVEILTHTTGALIAEYGAHRCDPCRWTGIGGDHDCPTRPVVVQIRETAGA